MSYNVNHYDARTDEDMLLNSRESFFFRSGGRQVNRRA